MSSKKKDSTETTSSTQSTTKSTSSSSSKKKDKDKEKSTKSTSSTSSTLGVSKAPPLLQLAEQASKRFFTIKNCEEGYTQKQLVSDVLESMEVLEKFLDYWTLKHFFCTYAHICREICCPSRQTGTSAYI